MRLTDERLNRREALTGPLVGEVRLADELSSLTEQAVSPYEGFDFPSPRVCVPLTEQEAFPVRAR